MKIFYNQFFPFWGFVIFWLLTLLIPLIFFAINIYLGIIVLVIIIIVDISYTYRTRKHIKWLKNTMEKDSFIQKSNFNFGFVGTSSISLISKNSLRVILHSSGFGNRDINYAYNIPKEKINIILNGVNVCYFDLSFSIIKSIIPKEGFGVRVETKDGSVYELDTSYAHVFCSEISKYIGKSLVEEKPNVSQTISLDTNINSEIKNLEQLIQKDKIENKKELKKFIKLIFKITTYFIFIPLLSLVFLVVMYQFSKNIHWSTATGIFAAGFLIFILSKIFKKKEELFINENNGIIILSSPLFIDLFSILGVVFILTGIFLNYDIVSKILFAKDETLAVNKNLVLPKLVIGAVALFLYYRAYRRLRYSLFDKIIITNEKIIIDDPKSTDSIILDKKEITKIVEVIERNSKTNKVQNRSIDISLIKEGNQINFSFDENYLAEMNISFTLFVNSLIRSGYIFSSEK